jgi:hypothetical protein
MAARDFPYPASTVSLAAPMEIKKKNFRAVSYRNQEKEIPDLPRGTRGHGESIVRGANELKGVHHFPTKRSPVRPVFPVVSFS